MAHYLLSVWTPADGTPPTAEELDVIMTNVDAVQAEMREAGVWVFAGGLEAPSTATVLTAQKGTGQQGTGQQGTGQQGSGQQAGTVDGDVLVTDGPYVELKEYLGGLTIIDVPDLDAAMYWARRSTQATTLPVEVRPFHWG